MLLMVHGLLGGQPGGAAVSAFTETFVSPKDQKGTEVDPIDATFVGIPTGSNRIVLDLITHSYGTVDNGTVISDILSPGSPSPALTRIANVSASGGATTCEIWRLLESAMPTAGGYTLSADYGRVGGAELFREVIVLRDAGQTLTANTNSGTNISVVTVTVTRASGQFPIGSIVYGIATDGNGALTYSVTGDAIEIRDDVNGWIGGNGHCFARGRLAVAKSPVSVTFTLSGAAARLSGAVVVVEPVDTMPAIQPVTIQGDRLYSGGSPYFFTGHFLWNISGQLTALNYLADATNATERQQILAQHTGNGWNSMDILLLNDGDANFPRVSPYASSNIGGSFDTTKLATWRTLLLELIDQRIRPILWLRSDDSPLIDGLSVTAFKGFIDRMVQEFDDLPVMWVLGLEADEYWTLAESNDYGAHLAAAADNPVGIHQLSNQTSYMTASWVEFGFYQRDTSDTWQTHYTGVISAKNALGTKPLVFSEYQQTNNNGLTNVAQQAALAGAFAGAAGFGNGGPAGLGAFMESLPDGMTPSRNGDILTLTGSGVTATANMATLTWSKTP